MGRSRRRARAAGDAAAGSARPPRAADRKAARAATVTPTALRRSLGAYLAGALALAVVVLVATVALAPAWAPWLVLAVDAAASFGLYRWAHGRMADLPLSDEDRVMQTLATGLLVIVLVFAAVAAVVLTAT
ncbi:MAG TPA: hypothetical protein VFT50_06910 [Baekduia sp.]|nr:hypothetical protein [Baekduia sp.]